MKRIAGSIISFVLLAALLCATPAFSPRAEEAGTPVPDGFTHIYDREGLEAIAENPNGNYILEADIDLGGAPWQPIPFNGTLEGNGHALLNLTIAGGDPVTAVSVDGNHKEYDTGFAALFSRCVGATIQNLDIWGADVSATAGQSFFASVLAGYAEDVTLTNCGVQGKVALHTDGINIGVAGLLGFGWGEITNCRTDVELALVDTAPATKSEEFMGGAMATGYADISGCDIKVRAYTSVSGYVHNGGIAGMYYVHTDDAGHMGYVTGNTVDAEIYFFEDNDDRRAYCDPAVGEQLNWSMAIADNTATNYVNGEVFDYSTTLLPNPCKNPAYTETVTPATCHSYGYSTYACATCGYTYTANYTPRAHQPGDWLVVKEPTGTENGLRVRYCTQCGEVAEEEVLVAASECILNQTHLSLHYKGTAQLAATLKPDNAANAPVTFTSSDETVATVDENGNVAATGRGEAVITCAAEGGATATCGVDVGYSFGQWLIVILLFGWIWY